MSLEHAPHHPAPPAVPESVLEDALRAVIDPEVGMDVMTMGLVYALFIDGGHVTVVYTLTTPHCPLGDVLERDIVDALAAVPGVQAVTAERTFDPPWSPAFILENPR